ncbi:MAG: 2-oxo acid dehydrogenase subunit E2 [Gemmataceae bacterium]|nr:2-oxo acid dehydrogenase subunit E2 [Gemmataceae bacterium]
MPSPKGRNLPLSPPRRFISDLLHFTVRVPTVPVERRMDVEAVALARAEALHRPSWCTVFTKAYALVAAARPELRRAYLPFPWARLYEHPHSVASIAIERQWRGEAAVLFAHLRAPEKQPLLRLDQALRHYRDEPIENIGLFRRIARLTRLPWPLRRLVWWALLNTSGYRRARQLGTFGVSVYSALGCQSLHPLSPLTTTLNYGVISRRGRVTVRLVYDHRVLDGSTVARALADLEGVLNGPIADELRGLAPLRPPTGRRAASARDDLWE